MTETWRPTWVDGQLRAAEERVVRASDPGFLLGLAAFETLLWEDRTLYFVDEHLARLARTATGLGLETGPWSPRAALDELCVQLPDTPLALRLTLTPGAPGHGPSLILTTRAWSAPDARGVGATLVERAKLAGDPLEALKTSSRLRNALARREAQALGAWEALLATDEGDITEGCISNVFAVLDGRLVTPPTSRGALAGIVRDKLIEDLREGAPGPVVERRLDPEDLRRASEVFLTNSLARVAPLRWIHGLRDDLPGGEGPLAREAARRICTLEVQYRAAR